MSKGDKTLLVHSCRICMDSKSINTILLDDDSDWLQLFQYCFGISLSTQDKPRNLCQPCAKQVKDYSRFKELCLKSDKLWKSILNLKSFTGRKHNHKSVKDDIFDHELNSNEIFNAKVNNCMSAAQLNSDLDNCNDNTEEFFIPIKTDKSQSPNNNVSLDSIDRDAIHLQSIQIDIPLGHQPNIHRKETANQSIKQKLKGLLTCNICQKKYGSRIWYLKHLKSCKLQKIANQNQESRSGTKLNLQENKKILKCYKNISQRKNFLHFCGICKFSSNNANAVAKHLDGHWTNNDLSCMLCEFIAKDEAAIAAHRYNHYAAKTFSYQCHICQQKTKSQLTLQFHYRKVHLNKIGGLCSQLQCDKAYHSWKLWKRHEKLHSHPGYICDFCGQKYRHKHVIVEHLGNHVNPTTYVCDVCGKTFLRLRNLRVHIENVHVKSEPLKCSHCDRMFKNQHYLRIHQKLSAMEKIWKCEFCPMEYPQLSLLNSHLKSHSEERPHCCHICGSRYKAKSQLVIHMRNHTGDRPYKCPLCGKAFKSAQLLRRHTMIHTGLRPHKCLYCEKTFLCKNRMMKHCSMRHKMTEK